MANSPDDKANPAAALIRQKLTRLYQEEPNAREELREADSARTRSKHQQFMHELGHSGKSLAEIQTAWHNYYVDLPDVEKHQVWHEFYAEHGQRLAQKPPPRPAEPAHPHAPPHPHSRRSARPRTVAAIKQDLLGKVQTKSSNKPSHLRSLFFGLACGSAVILLLLFGLFNERFIAPFITPSKSISNNSIIIDPSSTAAGKEPLLIIPKINVEIPVIYDVSSIEEDKIQKALERGVVHYPNTSYPGEKGNGAIFGHSSNNIFNSGKYKFAFVLLKRLEPGDTFILQKDSKRYVYKVYDKKIIKPDEVSILSNQPGKTATFALITCDPPGTTINRLVVLGEQITPDPAKNTASTAQQIDEPEELPGNAPSLWHRLTGWLSD